MKNKLNSILAIAAAFSGFAAPFSMSLGGRRPRPLNIDEFRPPQKFRRTWPGAISAQQRAKLRAA